MKKKELEKIWKQLDGACEAIEKLEYDDMDVGLVDMTAIVILKNKVEELINKKSRKNK